MTAFVEGLLEQIGQHPTLALILAFLIALTEGLFLIGLFVPSTVMLFGIGGLVGLGKLPFWPIFLATTFGAAAGDFLSYWIGRVYKERLFALWPFSRYPMLVAAGQRYFAKHGGKSVVIGRFIPGIKTVVPGIAGMVGMNFARFAALNVSSSFAWAAAHIAPGVSAGWALLGLGMISKRLAVVTALLLLVAVSALWLAGRLAALGTRYAGRARGVLIVWANGRRHPAAWLVRRLVGPEHGDLRVLVALNLVFAAAVLGFVLLLEAVASQARIVMFDTAFSQFLQSLRTQWTDAVMVWVTMLGDKAPLMAVAAATGAVLLVAKRRRLAAGFGLAVATTAGFVWALKPLVHASRPVALYAGADAYSFPSGHAAMSAVVYGLVGLILYRGLRGWSGWFAAMACSALIVTICFSRIYLAAHWPSDVLAGLALAAAVVSVFALVFRSDFPAPPIARRLLVVAGAALLIAGSWHGLAAYDGASDFYAPQRQSGVEMKAPWRAGGWADFPARRVDLDGAPEEPFLLQWRGGVDSLLPFLARQGWVLPPAWSILSLNAFVGGAARGGDLPVIPKLHNGRTPALTMIKTAEISGKPGRYVLRGWTESATRPDGARNIYVLVSVMQERIARPLGELSLPLASEKRACDGNALLPARTPNASRSGPMLPPTDAGCGGQLMLASP